MSGLISAMNSGKTSLSTNQKAIEVVGNNIANVNTPGYSRQRPILTPYPALNFGDFFIGQGVKLSNIRREHDVFLTAQLRNNNRTLGEETGKATALNELERVFNMSENNLATEIDRFFDAWQELTVNPSGQVERDVVLQRGALLAKAFQSTIAELERVQTNINNTLVARIDGVNFKLQEIADLNQRIAAIETGGQTANTMRDRRDLLLEELSFTLGIQTYEEGDTGMVGVQLPGGLPLVQGNSALKLEAVVSGTDMQLQVRLGETVLPMGSNNLGGEFKGMLDMRDRFIPGLVGDLDRLAYNLVTAVNTQHQAGVGLDGVVRDFFAPFDADPLVGQPGAATNIALLLTDPRHVAAGEGSAPGDNLNAQRMAALGQAKVIGGVDTFVSFHAQMTARVGIEAGQNRLSREGAEDAMVALQNLRDGKVGVSIEEEMIDLIKYQKSFEASAKLLAIVDEMLETILSIKR